MNLATMGVMAGAGSSSTPFNPLTTPGWYAAYWASDPDWTNPGDGNNVTSWRDATGGGRHLTSTETGEPPSFSSSVAALNGKPAIVFETESLSCVGADFGTLSQPFSILAIFNWVAHNVGTHVLIGSARSSNPHALLRRNAQAYNIFAGAGVTIETATDTNAHMYTGFFSGASSSANIDGTDNTVSPGTSSMEGFSALRNTSGGATNQSANIAFMAAYSGDIRAHANWANFKSWVTSEYGITMS